MALNTLPNAGLTNRGYPSDRLVTPMIINGDMSVAQRGTSTTGVGAAVGFFACDRWRYAETGSLSFRATISQSTTVPTGQGFLTSFKVDCTTAQGSLASADRFGLDQKIEAQNLINLKQGTSSADKTTLSFWVRSNLTGQFNIWVYKPDGTARSFVKGYTISSADTWEKKIINIPADTDSSGAIANDNGEGWRVTWMLGAGSNFTSGSIATTWQNYVAANIGVSQTNFASSTANEFYLTGVQLEVGEFDSTSIPAFPFESFESNLRKCYRYTQKHPQKDTSGNYGIIAQGMADGSTLALCNINPLPVEMRTTASLSSSGSFRAHKPGGASSVSSIAINSDHVSSSTFAIRVTTSGITAGNGIFLEQNNDSDAHIILDAEL